MDNQRRSDSHRRRLGGAWDPTRPTLGGYFPEHWYRSDGPLWQDAGVTAAAADGDPVGRWEDKTANADHVNQAVAGNKPTLQKGAADLLNGHAVIRFDAADDYLQGAFTTGGQMNQPNTVFAVAALDAAEINDDAADVILDGDDNTHRHLLYKSGSPDPDVWAIMSGLSVTGDIPDANWNIWSALFNGASSQFWLNGISEAAGDAGVHSLDGATIGANATTSTFFGGDIAEVIIYGADLPDADKNQVGEYLAARYGLSYTPIA